MLQKLSIKRHAISDKHPHGKNRPDPRLNKWRAKRSCRSSFRSSNPRKSDSGWRNFTRAHRSAPDEHSPHFILGVRDATSTVRVGCRLVYEAIDPTPIVLIVRPRLSVHQFFIADNLIIEPRCPYEELTDWLGNPVERWELPSGRTVITNDSLIEVPAISDDFNRRTASTPVVKLPQSVFRYLLPSRYCDSDKVQDFASRQFGYIINGVDRVIAISNWVHHNIRYVTGSGRSDISASEIMARGYGVCRDFGHVGIALCRAVNIPARYVTGHLPDIGVWDPGSPMDFHAYMEVYLDGQWCVFDARYNVPRIGRVKIAHGLDAADCAFSTTFGDARLTSIQVWAYQVNPNQVALGDPVDMSKRLDGTPRLNFV